MKKFSKLSVLINIICFKFLVNFSYANEILHDFYQQMQYLTKRDKLIAQNIQNSDTPKYLPQDIKKNNKINSTKLIKTHPSHIDLSDGGSDSYKIMSSVNERKPNGNAVNIDKELFKKSENAFQLNETINVYNKSKSILNLAINGSGK